MSTAKGKIRTVITDDHQIFVEGIKALIKDSDKISLVGEASNGEELLDLLKSKDVDVVLMDVNMPKLNGIETTQRIKSQFPQIKVLGLTMMEDARHIAHMMKAGASGYLLKTTGKDELIQAIEKVNEGMRYLSDEVSKKLIDRMLDNEKDNSETRNDRTPQITKREAEIIKLIAQEMTNDEIAKHLKNSPMTIITHRKNLLRKLNLKNTAGLIKYAMQHGLID